MAKSAEEGICGTMRHAQANFIMENDEIGGSRMNAHTDSWQNVERYYVTSTINNNIEYSRIEGVLLVFSTQRAKRSHIST